MAAAVATRSGWEEAGRKMSVVVEPYSAVVITAENPVAAAEAALGIARQEAQRRRVAIGDLAGELPPLQSLIIDDDPHGIADSFLYGISFNKIGRPVDESGNLFVMPSGSEPVLDPEIFKNDRWQRLANGFKAAGALLILVAPAGAEGLDELIDQLDGVVLVGSTRLDHLTYLNVVGRIPQPEILVPKSTPTSKQKNRRKYLALAALAFLVTVAGGLIALESAGKISFTARTLKRPLPATPVVSQPKSPPTTPPPPPPETLFVAPVAPPYNPADSARAASFAVEILAANTAEGANFELKRIRTPLSSTRIRESGETGVVGTVSPVPIGSDRITWYKVVAGAYESRRDAELLLGALRKKKIMTDSVGMVIKAPLALLLDSTNSSGTSQTLKKYLERDVPAYALRQQSGVVYIYAGAFTESEESAVLASTLRTAGMNPILAYRTGRTP